MNPGARPHERAAIDDLEAELDALGAQLRSTALPEPPAACDAVIGSAAREAAHRKRHGSGRFSGVLAAAATVSLAVGIGWHALRGPEPAAVAGGPGAAAAARAPAPAPLQAAAELDARVADATAATGTAAATDPGAPVPPVPAFGATAVTTPASAEATAPVAATAAPAAAAAPARAPAATTRPEPEAWLARIEALRRAGRLDEALREEALLDATWPGWRQSAAASR